MLTQIPKFTGSASFDDGPFDYGNRYFRQPCGNGERLVIGPTDGHIALMDELSAGWNADQFYILYVLLSSHTEAKPGRYASPLISSHEDLRVFLWTYQEFFEGDGRHHIWIARPDAADMLVYDHHNVIFAYGDLNAYERILSRHEFSEEDFWFPVPHSHGYPTENIPWQDRVLGHWDWHVTELQPGDEWE